MLTRGANIVVLLFTGAFVTAVAVVDAEAQSSSVALAERIRALKIERTTAALTMQSAAAKSAKPKTVDCTQGQSIQSVLDKATGPVVIDVRGICQENVLIEGKTVTLRGLDPATDGIQGIPASPPPSATLVIRFAEVTIENLSISNGPANGVRVESSTVVLENCDLLGNVGAGLVVRGPGFTLCRACDLASNTGFAASATNGGMLSLHDSTVTGPAGLRSTLDGSYADIDCATSNTLHACNLSVSGRALWAVGGGTAALYSAGTFDGRVQAFDRGHVFLLGASQQSLTGVNSIELFSTLLASADFDVPQQSKLLQTNLSHFSRAVLLDQTVLDANLTCFSAEDAWIDPGVVTGSNTITGCEHASAP